MKAIINSKLILRNFIILILLLFPFSGFAQKIFVSGQVTSASKEVLQNVHVVSSTGKIGTTTNENGLFYFEIPPKPTTLLFTHIGYGSEQIKISKQEIERANGVGIVLDIVLFPKDIVLEPFEVKDVLVEVAYDNPKIWILDYELIGEDEILLLINEKNKNYLQLIDSEEEIISKINVKRTYEWLYKDCMGYYHLLSNDSACQIFLADSDFLLTHHIRKQDFENVILPIIVETPDYLYTKANTMYNQISIYNKMHKLTSDISPFVEIVNEDQLEFNKVRAQDLIALYSKLNLNATKEEIQNIYFNLVYFKDSETAVKTFGKGTMNFELFKQLSFFVKILTIPPSTTLDRINNNLYLFNHLGNKIMEYDLNGNNIRDIEINYHNRANWDKEIIVNEEKTKCYAKFFKDGKTTLSEIDLITGNLINDIPLELNLFTEKIKVRGNYIYYLSRNYSDDENRFIWRQKM